jgi:hypothetical protein
MKKLSLIISSIILAAGITACTNNPDKMGSSTPIDSSNVNGAPGATYGPDNPASPNPPRYEGQYDTGLQPNTMNSQDSTKEGLK